MRRSVLGQSTFGVALLDAAPLPVVIVGPDDRVALWNRAAATVSGWVAEERHGLALADAFGGDARSQDALHEPLRRCRAGEVLRRLPFEGRRRDGGPLELELSLAPLRGDDGETFGTLVVAADVGAAHDAERALRSNENRLRKILQNISDTITIIDRDGRSQEGSHFATPILGYDAEFWRDRSVFEVIHPDDVVRAAAEFEQLLAEPNSRMAERMRVRHADGSWQVAEGWAVNLLEDPDVRGILLTTRNVTERTRAEALIAGQAEVLGAVARGAPLDETLGLVAALVQTQHDDGWSAVVIGEEGAPLVVTAPRTPEAAEAAAALLAPGGPLLAALRDGVERLGDREAQGGLWSAPVRSREADAPLGVVAALGAGGGPAAAHHAAALRLAADLAAIATERRRTEERMAHQALHDELTGLANRNLLIDRLELALNRARRQGSRLAVMFLDLDHFKVINDSFGHAAGDRVLQELAGRLRQVVRPEDTVARFGGDEFVVLIERFSDAAELDLIAERIEQSLSRPVPLGERRLAVTCSIGIALADGEASSPAALLRDADKAMFRAKEQGRGRLAAVGGAGRARVSGAGLGGDLAVRRALERGELTLELTPMAAIASGEVVAVRAAAVLGEAPERAGAAAPEDAALANELVRWSLDAAAAAAAAWPGDRPVWVDAAWRDDGGDDLAAAMTAALEHHRVPAARLVLCVPADAFAAERAPLAGGVTGRIGPGS
ncbi:MAG: diguanylate cyclase domain-containing protein, partial [Acidimicrobiales bacterium]